MKKIMSLFLASFVVLALANCGSDDSPAPAPPAPAGGVADGAEGIHFEGDNESISWTNSRNDIYVGDGSDDCVYGLNQGADDDLVSQRILRLESLLNSGNVARGTAQSASNNSRYLTIDYSNGESKTYNLDPDLASSDEEYLSNGDQIVAYYDQVANDLEEYGQENCSYGKGDK